MNLLSSEYSMNESISSNTCYQGCVSSLGLGLSQSRPYKFHFCYKLLKKYSQLPVSFISCKEVIEMDFFPDDIPDLGPVSV